MDRSFSNLASGSSSRLWQRRLWSKVRRYSRAIVQNKYVQTLVVLLTIYALFGEDIRYSCSQKESDIVFDSLTLLAMSVFAVEMVLTSLGVDVYRLSFFFWLDLISTCSLILDLSFVAESLFGGEESAAQKSQLGARSARLARLVRLIRLFRIVKLYQSLRKTVTKKQSQRPDGELRLLSEEAEEEEAAELVQMQEDDELPVVRQESRISKRLSERMTKKVILLILCMVLAKPFLQNDQYFRKDDESSQAGLDAVHLSYLDAVTACVDFSASSDEYISSRLVYEHTLLQYVYYHNWQARKSACPQGDTCYADTYTSFLFRLSFTVPSTDSSTDPCYNTPQITQLLATVADGSVETLTTYADNLFDSTLFNMRVLDSKAAVIGRLTQPWTAECAGSDMQMGVSLADDQNWCPENLRFSERTDFVGRFGREDGQSAAYFGAFFDKRGLTRRQALLSIYQTLFICFVLAFGAVFFARDANTLLLEPIERMIKKVELIRVNPLHAIKLGDEQYKKEEIAKAKLVLDYKRANNWFSRWLALRRMKQTEPLETVLLEKTIIKIGSLLAVGFGEAGAEILGKNMQGSDSGINAMVPGRRVEAIFGICTIQNFGLLTSVLQDKVLLLVNQVAEILHSVVNEYHGVANRNINDAFLLVWKLPELADNSAHAKVARERFADFALVAFSKVLVAVGRSPALCEYRSNPKILQFMADYKVTLNFGIHAGWAIEGAIGSEFKIDATYLSQDAAMVNLIEAWNKEYGTKLLCSGSFVDRLSARMKQKLRKIDSVKLHRSRDTTALYTLDLDADGLAARMMSQKTFVAARRRNVNPFKVRQLRESRKLFKMQHDYNIAAEWEKDVDYLAMRKKFTSDFQDLFNMAYLNYEAGQWDIARGALDKTRLMLGCLDGPSEALHRHMAQFDFVPPKDWRGFRELNE